MNVSPAGNYKWWLNSKTSKPIDELNRAAFQFAELTSLPVVIAFVDFKSNDPQVISQSHDLVALLGDIADGLDHMFKFFWTDDPF